jgi:hypothetical protein
VLVSGGNSRKEVMIMERNPLKNQDPNDTGDTSGSDCPDCDTNGGCDGEGHDD